MVVMVKMRMTGVRSPLFQRLWTVRLQCEAGNEQSRPQCVRLVISLLDRVVAI